MRSKLLGRLLPAVLVVAAALPAHDLLAQAQPSPNCVRLEAQLAAFDRGSSDPAKADQIRRLEETAQKQQSEIDRQQANSQRLGCERNSFFVLFSGQPAQCGPLGAQLSQMRAGLERTQSELARAKGGDAGPEREGQRRALIGALAQNDCGPQYKQAAAAAQPRGGLFESLFGGNSSVFTPGEGAPAGTYRTVCVRTCDGYFYPISFATTPAKFAEDEKTCQNSCPAAEVMLFSHRNPGEDINQAIATSSQQPYTSLPNAFKYRQAFDNACSCRRAGESWAQTLKTIEDTTVQTGDIVVNPERARQMSQPRFDAQGKPIRPEPLRLPPRPDPKASAATSAPLPSAEEAPAADPTPVKPDPNRTVRSVGPTFLPAR